MRKVVGFVVAAAVVGLAAGAAVWYLTSGRPRPIAIEPADVVRVELMVFPEQSPGAVFAEEGTDDSSEPVELAHQFLPNPLPAPLWQGLGCDEGRNVAIDLRDGRRIVYGPCRLPAEIDQLWNELVRVWRVLRQLG